MLWQPSVDYRYAFKKGMQGTDVAALQVNLQYISVDGVFGPATKQAVIKFQQNNNLVADGVAGPATMQALVKKRSAKATINNVLPQGLLDSIAINESNFNVAAVSVHPSDTGLDIGAYQLSTGKTPGSQNFYQTAYDVSYASGQTGIKARQFHDAVPNPVTSQYFTDLAGTNSDKFKWQMTILNHNWQEAAWDIPRYGYIFEDHSRDDAPADWIIKASGGRLSTPREWVMSYIERASVFINW